MVMGAVDTVPSGEAQPPPSELDTASVVERFALAAAEAKLIGGPPDVIRLGRYMLLDRLGAGGMGTVFSAYDPQLDRRVAIKVVHPNTSAPRASERLVREARALAKLSHPNIVTVFDTGVVGSEVYIAMELVAGRTLLQWCETPRHWKEVRDVLAAAARGLCVAHRAGMVHRDFKPANVLIGDDGLVRVLDFGLARSMSEMTFDGAGMQHTDTLSTLTTAGNVMGTPAYMAPEQLLSGVSHPSTDQFGFFVTLYEALYGVRPCPAMDLRALVQTLSALRVPEKPPRSDVPLWLHRVLIRGLSIRPENRYASMDEVLAAMHADLGVRRRRAGWLLAGLLTTLSTGAGVAYALTPGVQAPDTDPVAGMMVDARAAAARSYFVYGPVDDPRQRSAYQVVVALDNLGSEVDGAGAAAQALREEFSTTLLRLGDAYWEREGGAPFSADYYAMALVFDPDLPRARTRTSLTSGELASLATKAAAGSFSEAERLAGESLAALAEPDPVEQAKRVALLAQRERAPAPSTIARLQVLVGVETPTPEASVTPDAPPPRRRAPTALPPQGTDTDAADPPQPVTRTADPPAPIKPADPPEPTPRIGRKERQALVEEASQSAKKGNLDEADRLYRRVLSSNPSDAQALGGIAQLAFDRGAYHRALRYARRASKAAPGNSKTLILHGDVAYRVDYYDEAIRAYEAAAKLGSKTASSRRDYVREKTGR